jgi:hypothetical protein
MVRKTFKSLVAVLLCVPGVVMTNTADAQTSARRQKYEDIAARYKDEPAVYTNITERLTIKDEEGELKATSDVVMEKLLISDLSLNTHNTEEFSYGDFFKLSNYDGKALVPNKSGDYKTIDAAGFGEGGNASYTFMDDIRIVQAYYSGLSKGSVTTTGYGLDYSHLTMLSGHGFQREIPVLNMTYEVVAPTTMKMGFLVKGIDTTMIRRSVETKDGNTFYRFTAQNIPAYKHYDHVPSASYYVTLVFPYVKSFRKTGASKDSVMLNNIDGLYKYEYAHIRGINLKTDSFLNKKVAELTRNAYSDKEKAQNIYKWVQDNMHYVAFECGMEGFVPRQADTVFKRKYGDCKDMASILTAMCRKAGLEAYFTWIGSNNKPYTHSDMPTAQLYDHMISTVKLGDEYVFMDGTDKFLPFGANRCDLQGKEACISIDAKNYKVVKVPEAGAAQNTVTDNMTMTISNDDVAGSVTQHYTGYEAWNMIHRLSDNKRKDEKDKLVRRITRRGSDKYLVPRYDLYAQEAGNMDVNISADYTLGDYVQNVGKQTIVNMNAKHTFTDMRVNDSGRNVPVYLDNKRTVRETVTLNVPDGYRVTYLPKGAQGSVDGLWSYKLSYKEDKAAKKVILTKEYALNTMMVKPEQFAANNKLADDLKKQYNQTVVLTAKK